MTSATDIIRLRELIGDQRVAMFATTAPGNEIHSRPLTLAEIDDNGIFWFIVDRRAEWAANLAPGEPVNVSFTNEADKTWTSVAGAAAVVEDRAKIDRLWSPAADVFFPEGKDSGHVRLIAVDATSAEYWDAPSSTVRRLALIAKAKLTGDAGASGDSGSLDLS